MRARSSRHSRSVVALIAFAGLATMAAPAFGQGQFFPRVNLTGWPLLGGEADIYESEYNPSQNGGYAFWPGEERMGIMVQVYTNSHISGTTQENAEATAQDVFDEMYLYAKWSLTGTGDSSVPRCAVWLHNYASLNTALIRAADDVDADVYPEDEGEPAAEDWPQFNPPTGYSGTPEQWRASFRKLQPWMNNGRVALYDWTDKFAHQLKALID